MVVFYRGVLNTVAVISRPNGDYISGKAVMHMTTEMLINIIQLIMSSVLVGISIGKYVAEKKNDR